jgi:glutamate 5-kinase
MTSRRIVVKVGSTLVTNQGAGLDMNAIANWASQISRLKGLGHEVVLVSSGAVAEGIQRLGWTKRPKAMNELQAAAAVGQMGLIHGYEACFREHGLHTAQILLTHADLADRQRYLNARSTIKTLLALGVIPIINENDTVVTDEIRFGDNDTLGAMVTNLIEADWLVILTDIDGLFSADPRKDPGATILRHASAVDPALQEIAGGTGSSLGKGGMITKVLAARRGARSGATTIIAPGLEPDVLLRILEGEQIGTRLTADTTPLAARKQWLADHLQVAGLIHLDQGAAKALAKNGKSLLPVGIRKVEGEFERGAVVTCLDPQGREIARGLANYSSSETARISGAPSSEIEKILGYADEPEIIHRDNLVILQ